MSKKKAQNNYLNIMFAVIVLIIMIVLLSRSTNIVEKILVSYNTNSSIDYKVYIFSNDYVKSEYMGKNKTYIADLVDKINIDFDYSLTSSKKLDSTYTYDIIADAVVSYNSTGEELWSEELKLVENSNIDISDNSQLNIKNSVELPYSQLNNKVKAFKTQFNIPISAYVQVNLIVKDANNTQIASTGLSMDLFEEVFKITENSTGNTIQNITETKEPNKILLAIELLITLLVVLYIVYSVYVLFVESTSQKSYYANAIYKILKNYGDIVAEIVKPIDLTGLKIIDVKNFDQMLDVEEELRIPIMFYETIKNEEGHFVLVHRDMAYRYILKEKFKNQKNNA